MRPTDQQCYEQLIYSKNLHFFFFIIIDYVAYHFDTFQLKKKNKKRQIS